MEDLFNNINNENVEKIEGDEKESSKIVNEWPQNYYQPKYKTRNFLPPEYIKPTLSDNLETKKVGNYTYKDWRGFTIEIDPKKQKSTKERFEKSKNLPKSDSEYLEYSTRDHYLIFDDRTTDYFVHGQQILNNIGQISDSIPNKDGFQSFMLSRLSSYAGTPYELNDPVIYTFDLIIDNISSPLLNGSVDDFLSNYSNISEIRSRVKVYEEFKQQFVKFFKTRGTVEINSDNLGSTTISRGQTITESNDNISNMGKNAYMNYYIKKIGGLDKLIDTTTSYITDYGKDLITLDFLEDVTLSTSTLAHLYKLLYWSKPNGKGLVPENLLRFNCDIIITEIRNFKRIVNDSSGSSYNIKVTKDNLSRHVYSLKECQFFFDGMPHDTTVDIGGSLPAQYTSYSIKFNFKYSTYKLERFMPKGDGYGEYVSYNNGTMWKYNKSNETIESPRFFINGENKFNNNGVSKPFVLSNYSPESFFSKSKQVSEENINNENLDYMESLKERSFENSSQIRSNIEFKEKLKNIQFFESKSNISAMYEFKNSDSLNKFSDKKEDQPNYIDRLKRNNLPPNNNLNIKRDLLNREIEKYQNSRRFIQLP